MNLQKILLSEDRYAVKKEVVQERKIVSKLLDAVSNNYEFVQMEVMEVTERITYRTATLMKETQLRTAPVHVRTAVSDVMNFKVGTELIFAWEVDDRVERGLKPLYTFILPTGNRFPFYPEEFVWSDYKTIETKHEIPLTDVKERKFININLGSKKENKEKLDLIGEMVNEILNEEEIKLLNKYYKERLVDEDYVLIYNDILTKISKAARKIKRGKKDE